MSQPDTFRVDARVGTVRGGGRLTVQKGAIVLETDRLTRGFSRVARVVHTDSEVTLVKARLVPPWFNTSLVLHDDEAACYAMTWVGARNRLRRFLRAAGFDVQEVATWFSPAGDRATSPPTVRASRRASRLSQAALTLATVAAAAAAIVVVGHSPLFVAFAAVCVALTLVPILRA